MSESEGGANLNRASGPHARRPAGLLAVIPSGTGPTGGAWRRVAALPGDQVETVRPAAVTADDGISVRV